jgi:hypothetical protein
VRTTILASLAACGITLAATAHAETTPNQAMADALFRSAKDHLAAGDYAVACAELRESENLDPQVGTALNLAYCYEQLGRTASAWSTWLEAAAAATAKGQTERADVASVRAALLKTRLLHLTITVRPQRARERIRITVDSAPVPPDQWGAQVPEDPGDHELVATADGFRSWHSRFSVGTGTEPTIAVPELEPIAPVRDARPANDGPSVGESVALATGALGAASVVVGGGFGIAALVRRGASNSRSECVPTVGCNGAGLVDRARARDDAMIADWTLGVGGAVVVASAIAYVILLRTHAPARAASWSTGVFPSRTGASLMFRAEW